MKHRTTESKRQIIEQLLALIEEQQDKTQAALLVELAKRYYISAPVEDLIDRDERDLYAALASHWNLIKQRKPNETCVHLYNPQFEEHGWSSTHTVVEIAHDDMPFLVDSLSMEINRLGYTIHLIFHVGNIQAKRDKEKTITEFLPMKSEAGKSATQEAAIYFEIDRQTDPDELQSLTENLTRVLNDVTLSVADWKKMRAKAGEAIKEIDNVPLKLDEAEIEESKDFLRWIDSNFTFIGYREYRLCKEDGTYLLRQEPDTGLGVLRNPGSSEVSRTFAKLPAKARRMALSSDILIISKTNTVSTVHRRAYTDYIGVKRYDEKGKIIGERRFIGLYTSSAYHSNPRHIPFLRHKVDMVLNMSNLSAAGHAGKDLLHILETLPRDDLFQTSTEELFEMTMGILSLQERKRIRLFTRKDIYGRFISALVYVPRELYNTIIRERMEKILMEDLGGTQVNFSTYFSESVLARIHFVVRVDPHKKLDLDLKEIEKRLIAVGRTWQDDLLDELIEHYGEELGVNYTNKYGRSFPTSYLEEFEPRTAVYDIGHIETLKGQEDAPLAMSFYRPVGDDTGTVRLKLFRPDDTIPLSDALPMMENMGLRVIGERPYRLRISDQQHIWINDFSMQFETTDAFDFEAVRPLFQETFDKVWHGKSEDDRFNQLVLRAQLNWREIVILRAYAKYLRQTGFTFSQSYIEETLAAYPQIANLLVALFNLRFDVEKAKKSTVEITKVLAAIEKGLDDVANLDQDRILRRYLDVIQATLRTNYFQRDEDGEYKTYISIKLDPSSIPDLPLPLPMFEIFVYSPNVEGVHLRGAKVARGGIRWSDRREDFRTEVLGLMKAQQVKNAVIVPLGAKGGFVPKNLPVTDNREEYMKAVVDCYVTFMRGLLDLTDNLKNGKVVPPKNVVRYDEDDYYLVVAADKGTATFSDIANGVAMDYGFWLGDAFASGGCTGYDHKKMGITARGAWESVKRHFRELGLDTQNEDFTVVGIGDMAGDVFGNGMLLSKHIRLVGAFNHMHIFIDPNPEAESSFEERKRLFDLPRSSWEDYDKSLISRGGAVFKRSEKSIQLTPEIKSLLGLEQDHIVPNDLIQALLRAEVDLIWNGGIGTYVKSAKETHSDVGDRANDSVRVNGGELRCRVGAEGGNLGFTQLGRIEYSLKGGIIYTDFIDNSGGVDCSDHEVNIKILLNDVVTNGDMTLKQRNELLSAMSDEVAELVLQNNYRQTSALSTVSVNSIENIELHRRYIQELERTGSLNRALEFLPDEEGFAERQASGQGLTRPELAVVMAYTKTIIKGFILDSNVPEDPFLSEALASAFPQVIRERFSDAMEKHSLRREIIATQLSNTIVNEMGLAFVHRLLYETGMPVAHIVRAYAITRVLLDLPDVWKKIEGLDNKISFEVQTAMSSDVGRLARRCTRWFLRNRRSELDINKNIADFSEGMQILTRRISKIVGGKLSAYNKRIRRNYIDAGVPEDVASSIASVRALYPILDIIDGANEINVSVSKFAVIYYAIGDRLNLGWVRQQISLQPVENHWDALARAALRDDIDKQQRGITKSIILKPGDEVTIEDMLEKWIEDNAQMVRRWEYMLADLRTSSAIEFTMFAVAVRELLDLAQASLYAVQCLDDKTGKTA